MPLRNPHYGPFPHDNLHEKKDHDSSSLCSIGQYRYDGDGCEYVYARTEATIAVSLVCVGQENSQAIAATYFGVDSSTAPIAGEGGAIGDKKVRLTADVTGVTAAEYSGGNLFITDGTGKGYKYRISTNQASATGGFLVWLDEPYGIAVALDNTSVGKMHNNPCYSVIACQQANFAEDQNQVAVGVAMAPTAGGATTPDYIWLQTKGDGLMISGVVVQKHGCKLQIAEDVDGYVEKPVSGEDELQILGVPYEDTTSAKHSPCKITIG